MNDMNIRPIIAGLAAAVLASCAARLPQPETDIPSSYVFGGEFSASGMTARGKWWTVYGDTLLNSLEERALAGNRNLAIAASRIETARRNLAMARAAFLPAVNTEVSAEGEYKTPAGHDYELVVQPTVSWNVSLFGALRHTTRKAAAEVLATEWACRGVLLSLTKEVAVTYFTLLQSERCLDIALRSRKLRVESAALIDSMVRYGFSTGLDLEQAQSLVYSADADIPQYRRAMEQAQLSLNTLLGEAPHAVDNIGAGKRLDDDRIPVDIPVGLPSDLLERRPDIMEAYYELQSAAAQVGIARSNRFPSVQLTGSGGLFGSSAKELFTKGYWSWGASGSVVQPLFSFGRLKHSEQVARDDYRRAALTYEQTVLAALEEVESALVAVSTYRSQAERYRSYVASNGRIWQLTNSLYLSGMSDYLDVISTEQTWYNSQIALIGLIAQQYISYADLVMALGDGWQTE